MNSPIRKLLASCRASDISDFFFSAGKVPSCRKKGEILSLGGEELSAKDLDNFRLSILREDQEREYKKNGTFDISLQEPSGRYRLNFYHTFQGPAIALRPIHSGDDLTFESLKLPSILADFAFAPRGLILICGATGSGKSTTMAAMISHINREKNCHILTLEDPVEYLYTDRKSIISQREIDSSCNSFSASLRSAMRENPDVIVVGEVRDRESVETALNAALTGHLVITTIHTSDTIQAVERVISLFPEDLRERAASDLGSALVGLVAQRLIPDREGKGVFPAMEILSGTPSIKKLIANMDYSSLEDILQRGSDPDVMQFSRSIHNLYKEKKISLEKAMEAATNPGELDLLIKGMESGSDTFRCFYGDTSGKEDNSSIDMKRLLRTAVSNGASDLILSLGVAPTVRLNGILCAMDLPPLEKNDIRRLLFSIINTSQRVKLEANRELDLALSVSFPEKAVSGMEVPICRFRVNAFYQRGSLGVVCRVVKSNIPSPEELTLPLPLVELMKKQQGLILITGPTGSGKSTTLASLIDLVNRSARKHIITIEDPIEYVHPNQESIVEQRELNNDTKSFATALKYALRQDPDIIMVGEMRDTETMASAITAAETGHLVLATIHTNSAPQTIDRIVDSFPQSQQNQIRLQLAGTLLGVVSQRLLPTQDGENRCAAFELMIGTPPVLALIREGKTHQLQSVIETSHKDGMCTLDKSLEQLYNKGLISKEQTEMFRANYREIQNF